MSSRKVINRQNARDRAERQRVYISGFQGHHPLKVGLAYYYRGHFIYAYPACNPIQPMPFSTRGGISIVGIAKDLAPPYDPLASNLVPESGVSALHRASVNEQAKQQPQEEQKKPGGPPAPAPVPQILTDRMSYTPHDRAQYLSFSAPGSRCGSVANTPHPSRPVSPNQVVQSRGSLRPVASTSRLTGFLTEDAVRRAFSPVQELPEGRGSRFAAHLIDNVFGTDQPIENASSDYINMQSTPRQSLHSLALSQRLSPHIPDENTNNEVYRQDFGPIERSTQIGRNANMSSLPAGGSLGRPRAASVALNEAYNAAHPPLENTSSGTQRCSIHDETCDGYTTTTNKHLTEQARESKGFKDVYPTIMCGDGKVMINWHQLLQEERAKRRV